MICSPTIYADSKAFHASVPWQTYGNQPACRLSGFSCRGSLHLVFDWISFSLILQAPSWKFRFRCVANFEIIILIFPPSFYQKHHQFNLLGDHLQPFFQHLVSTSQHTPGHCWCILWWQTARSPPRHPPHGPCMLGGLLTSHPRGTPNFSHISLFTCRIHLAFLFILWWKLQLITE